MTMALYMITIVIVKAHGIIHIAFRVHALSNVIKMLATPPGIPLSDPLLTFRLPVRPTTIPSHATVISASGALVLLIFLHLTLLVTILSRAMQLKSLVKMEKCLPRHRTAHLSC